MKKVLLNPTKLITAGALLAPLAFPATALAQGNNVGINCDRVVSGGFAVGCRSNINDVLGNLVTIVFVMATLLAFAFLIFGGIRWILSGGDKEGTAKARGTITAAIIGLAIVFLSFVIMNVVGKVFGFDIFNLVLPKLT